MTSGDTGAVQDTSPTPDKAPPWAVYSLAGRDIEFTMPSPEQLMVLRRVSRHLSASDTTLSAQIQGMGKVLDAISACMVNPADVDYADDLVLSRKVDLEELVPMIQAVLRGPSAQQPPAPKNGPAKRVRRR